MEEKQSSGISLIEKNIHSDLSEIEEILKDFNKKCDEISILLNNNSSLSNITQIMMRFNNLQDLIKSINTYVSKIQHTMSASVKNSENDMALIKEIVYNSQIANRKFNSVSTKFMRIVETTRSQYEYQINSTNEDLQEQKLQKNKFYKQKIKNEEIRNEELNKEFESVLKITNQIHELSNTMLNELNMQGKKLSLIEENMIDSHNNLIRANQELDELAQSSGSKNRLFFWICTLLFVVFLIALLIFAFYYRKKQEEESKNSQIGDSNTVLDNTTIRLLNLRRNRNSSDIIYSDESNSFYINQSYNYLGNDENTSTDSYENDQRNRAKLDTIHKIDPFSQNKNITTTYNTSRNDSEMELINNLERDDAKNYLEKNEGTKLISNDYIPSEVPREIKYSHFSDSDLNATKYHSNKDNNSKNVTESVDYLPGDYKDITGSTNFLISTSKSKKEILEPLFELHEKAMISLKTQTATDEKNNTNVTRTFHNEIVPIPVYHITVGEGKNASEMIVQEKLLEISSNNEK